MTKRIIAPPRKCKKRIGRGLVGMDDEMGMGGRMREMVLFGDGWVGVERGKSG